MRWKMALTAVLVCLVFGLSVLPARADAAGTYKIRVNKQQNTVTVYQLKKGKYEPYKAFVCSTGENTPLGTFRIPARYRWRPLVASTYGKYSTRIVGSFLFHSVVYDKPDPSAMLCKEYNKLGKTASHGCIRLTVKDAKWIYDNCPNGTVVEIYNSKNPGPLGKPSAIKVSGKTGYDPTDIWSKGNPYNKKKPSITGAKDKEIPYGSKKYNVMTGIRAKNTTGFQAKKLVTCVIKYRNKRAGKYRSVKKVDTKSPGYYRITYRLTDEIGRKAKVTVVHRVLEAKPADDSTSVTAEPPVIQPSDVETMQNSTVKQ